MKIENISKDKELEIYNRCGHITILIHRNKNLAGFILLSIDEAKKFFKEVYNRI
jgi:hypothetical protein